MSTYLYTCTAKPFSAMVSSNSNEAFVIDLRPFHPFYGLVRQIGGLGFVKSFKDGRY